jgi:tellurite resistance protein TehA-like permease
MHRAGFKGAAAPSVVTQIGPISFSTLSCIVIVFTMNENIKQPTANNKLLSIFLSFSLFTNPFIF